MKSHIFFQVIFALLLQCALSVGTTHAKTRTELLRDPAPNAAATRTIVIRANTKYVNVTGGEIIKFAVGDKAFTWNFNPDFPLGRCQVCVCYVAWQGATTQWPACHQEEQRSQAA